MTWATLRDGVKDLLDGIPGLIVHDTYVDAADKTVAFVLPAEPLVSPEGHADLMRINFLIRLQATRATLKGSQDALDPFLWPSGSSSIVAALYAEPTLGGTVDDMQFQSVGS